MSVGSRARLAFLPALASIVAGVAGGCEGDAPLTCPTVTTVAVDVPASSDDVAEQIDLAGDFELLDPDSPGVASVEGVIPSLSDLNLPVTRRTMRYVEHFGATEKGRKTFFERFHKASRYREHIERKLRDRDLPEDLLWLVAIESGFNPQATSPAGAVGLFQFMPETAQRFELVVRDDIDERRSITRSSDAAIAYLRQLHGALGSWDLALAAYNCGEARVASALATAREKLDAEPDEKLAFHELADLGLLPRETAHFVPMIQAFAIVAQNRELLELEDLEPLGPMHFAEIAVPEATRLAVIAKAADVSLSTLRDYNPDLLTDRVPIDGGDHIVQIPADTLEHTLAALPVLIQRDFEKNPPPAKRYVKLKDAEEEAKTRKKKKKKKGKEVDASSAAAAAAEAGASKITLKPAPSRPGDYVLTSGVFVEILQRSGDMIEVSTRVDVLDPLHDRKRIGSHFRSELRKSKPSDLAATLAVARKDLAALSYGDGARALRKHLASERGKLFERAAYEDVFAALSERVFPESHPMHGALLVGTTEPADDMFLEPEPPWAIELSVTLSGPVATDGLGELLETVFADPLEPPRAPPAPPAGRAATSDRAREVLVGWSSPALDDESEAAAHLAFILACHSKLGRAHIALRRGTSIAANVTCSLELAPQATVGWIAAMPISPFSAGDTEKAIQVALDGLTGAGPTDQEVETARGLLRTELVREREMATIRGLPKAVTKANADRILGKIGEVDRAAVTAAAKRLFSKEHRVIVTGG